MRTRSMRIIEERGVKSTMSIPLIKWRRRRSMRVRPSQRLRRTSVRMDRRSAVNHFLQVIRCLAKVGRRWLMISIVWRLLCRCTAWSDSLMMSQSPTRKAVVGRSRPSCQIQLQANRFGSTTLIRIITRWTLARMPMALINIKLTHRHSVTKEDSISTGSILQTRLRRQEGRILGRSRRSKTLRSRRY